MSRRRHSASRRKTRGVARCCDCRRCPCSDALLAAPGHSPAAALIQDLIFVFYMLALAQCWNLLAGYAGLVSVGQQAFVGLGGYLLFALTLIAGIDPLLAIAARGADRRGCSRCRRRSSCSACAAPISRSAPGSWPRCIGWCFAQFKQLGGGTGTSLPPSVTQRVSGIEWVKACVRRAHAGRARHHHLLDGAGAAGRHARCWSISSCARATALRLPRSATHEAAAEERRRRHLPHQARGLCRWLRP